MNIPKELLFIPFVSAILLLASCQKEIDINDPDLIPEEVKDSTLLIKSISATWDKGAPNEESIIEYYSYDTVNREITITWNDTSGSYVADGTKLKLTYNTKGLLTHAVYNYPLGYVPWEFDYNTIDITYDASNVLQSIMTKYDNGSIKSNEYNKTMLLAGNYQLTWDDGGINTDDSIFRKVEFNKDGNAIINYVEYYHYPYQGAPGRYKTIILDSLTYDAGGNVAKVFRKADYNGTNDDVDFIFYEYTRQSKGDQLYNQRQVLMNGIANIPFGDWDDIAADAFGFLSFQLDYENLQYSKYPVQTVKARMWDGTFKDFTSNPTFDSKNRLTKFTGFFHDYDLEPTEYEISYYK